MNTVGRVDQIPDSGNTFARLVRKLQEENIRPTHFLIVQCTYHAGLANHLRQRVPLKMFEYIAGRTYSRELNGPDDVVSITWRSPNQGSSMIYYATSRLDESYVRQLTDELLNHANKWILEKADLNNGNFQMSYIVAKNLNYALNMANGDEAAVAVAGQILANANAPLYIAPAPAAPALAAPAAAAVAAAPAAAAPAADGVAGANE